MRTKIENCFGEADKVFAGHPVEINNAIELLKECIDNSISIETLIGEIEKYLLNNNLNQDHIDTQLDSVKKKFTHWL